ncbi:MAG: hypothetical protein R2862_07660 [Thermoanaerobaculia bacterium]
MPGLAPVLFLALAALATSVRAEIRPENKWRIQCSEGAKSDGTILFHHSRGRRDDRVAVQVARGTGRRGRASDPRRLHATLPADAFHVEVDDGEDVLVKRKGSHPKFALVLVSNDVKSVRIRLDRE